MNPDNVKNCMRCSSSLERGYSSRYSGDVCKEVICFKCDKKETMEDYLKDKVLTTRLIMDNSLELFHILEASREPRRIHVDDPVALEEVKVRCEIQIASNQIQQRVKQFESKVWFKGLQEQILATKCRGVSAKLGKKHNNFCVLTWTCAGRTMITIEDDNASVTCVADETSKDSRTGFHGVRANIGEALFLFDEAIRLYENGTLKFKDDDKVSMI